MYIISYLLDNKKRQTRIYSYTYIKKPGSIRKVIYRMGDNGVGVSFDSCIM